MAKLTPRQALAIAATRNWSCEVCSVRTDVDEDGGGESYTAVGDSAGSLDQLAHDMQIFPLRTYTLNLAVTTDPSGVLVADRDRSGVITGAGEVRIGQDDVALLRLAFTNPEAVKLLCRDQACAPYSPPPTCAPPEFVAAINGNPPVGPRPRQWNHPPAPAWNHPPAPAEGPRVIPGPPGPPGPAVSPAAVQAYLATVGLPPLKGSDGLYHDITIVNDGGTWTLSVSQVGHP